MPDKFEMSEFGALFGAADSLSLSPRDDDADDERPPSLIR
jgi:hypothetical protein